jgi:beta-glucosidase
MKPLIYATSLLVALAAAVSCSSNQTYRDPSAPIEARIQNLMSLMTPAEKASQLDMLSAPDIITDENMYDVNLAAHFIDSMSIGSIHDFYPEDAAIANMIQRRAVENTRLGIPLLFIEEGLHGYAGRGATTFPVPLGNATGWDTTMMHNIGRAIATEARAHGVHFLLAPNLDLGRDPRWGRIEETFGEDVYLNSRMAVNIIKGMQGNSLKDPDAVAAEPKHFGVHGIPEGGSNTGSVFIGEREARSTHLYVFEKAIREAHARGVMAAYHDIDGIPCISNPRLLTGLLREEWGFDGMVVTDLGAVRRLLEPHHTAANPKDAILQAIHAGMDMQFYDFDHDVFQQAIVDGLKDGSLSRHAVDRAVAAVLRIKFELGLFDNPYTDETLAGKVFHCEAHRRLALEAGRKSIVLLKNEHNVLPFSRNIRSIALVGSLANTSSIGGYSPKDAKGATVLEALQKRCDNDVRITHDSLMTSRAASADVIIVVIGETDREVGEGHDRQNLNLRDGDVAILQTAAKSGKPVVSVMLNGRPLVTTPVADHSSAVLEAWFPGEAGGTAIVDVLFGDYNPSGKLTVSIPKYQGPLPVYYSRKPASPRTYTDGDGRPLYPFGHGLSYTTFKYSNLTVTPSPATVKDPVTVSVDITNTGKTDGTETVQLYVRDLVASVATPIKALKGFSQIFLKAGETQTVHMTIVPEEHLWLIDPNMRRIVEPGEFELMAGSSSEDIRLTQTIELH